MLILKFYTIPVRFRDVTSFLNHTIISSKVVSIFYRENMTSFLNYVTATLWTPFTWRGSYNAFRYMYYIIYLRNKKIVAAFQGMHVSPMKHSYAWLQIMCDYRSDRQRDTHTHTHTDRCSTKWSLCATILRRWHKNDKQCYIICSNSLSVIDQSNLSPSRDDKFDWSMTQEELLKTI